MRNTDYTNYGHYVGIQQVPKRDNMSQFFHYGGKKNTIPDKTEAHQHKYQDPDNSCGNTVVFP